MPADITGTNIVVEEAGRRRFEFQKGPIFGNIVLADEINHATPKTQSALLEAMQEGSVTFAGQRFVFEQPFFVLATQNPIEMEGTYPLPEAQLDRFMFKLDVKSPTVNELANIFGGTTGASATGPNRLWTANGSLKCATLHGKCRLRSTCSSMSPALFSPLTPPAPKVRRWSSNSCAWEVHLEVDRRLSTAPRLSR